VTTIRRSRRFRNDQADRRRVERADAQTAHAAAAAAGRRFLARRQDVDGTAVWDSEGGHLPP
jgi:hypothetical protein